MRLFVIRETLSEEAKQAKALAQSSDITASMRAMRQMMAAEVERVSTVSEMLGTYEVISPGPFASF